MNNSPNSASSSLKPEASSPSSGISLEGFQELIRRMYFEKDAARRNRRDIHVADGRSRRIGCGVRNGSHEERLLEFADVLAWLATIANVAGVDLGEAVRRKYGAGCPGCGQFVCRCDDAEKP